MEKGSLFGLLILLCNYKGLLRLRLRLLLDLRLLLLDLRLLLNLRLLSHRMQQLIEPGALLDEQVILLLRSYELLDDMG
jgi:hypothetical protein